MCQAKCDYRMLWVQMSGMKWELGLSNLRMFLRYSHLDQEQGEGAMEKLNGLLSQKNGDAQLVGSK
ncbi:MAG: hypothetical protein PVG87_22360 [Desulfobacteraceae bacterium]